MHIASRWNFLHLHLNLFKLNYHGVLEMIFNSVHNVGDTSILNDTGSDHNILIWAYSYESHLLFRIWIWNLNFDLVAGPHPIIPWRLIKI